MKAKPFTAEQDEWLQKKHSPEIVIRVLTAEYNTFWGENRSVDTMKHHCKRLGLQQERGDFTPEQDAWLRKRNRKYSARDMTVLFNQKFGTHRNPNTIKVHCNRDLRVFFLNSHMSTGLPIGSEKIVNGYVWIKVSDQAHGKNSFYKNWRQKSHVVFEQHYGSMPPEGYTIVFLDGNKQNTSIENLYAVSGKVNREMGKKKWWNTDPDLTLAAIKWCELFYIIKEVK